MQSQKQNNESASTIAENYLKSHLVIHSDSKPCK